MAGREEERKMSETWSAFEIAEAEERRSLTGDPWLELLRVPSLRAGIYSLAAGAVDRQEPHAEDEVYHVIQGRAVFRVDGEDLPVGPGAVLYVAAGVDHRFHSIEEDLQVLVFFARR
jgi:mannose-6-phosphate isomerase-like protein (cupin superfamily)